MVVPAVSSRAGAWLLAPLLLLGCSDSSPTDPGGVARPLPLKFRLDGTASSTEADGSTVSCTLELGFELGARPRRAPGVVEYDGVHGGAIQRTVLDAAGDGISLWPHVHGEVIVRSIAPDRIEIEIPGNAGTGSRFWEQLSRLQGAFGPGETAEGGWSCAPFDVDSGGYVDRKYTARGSWTLAPVP